MIDIKTLRQSPDTVRQALTTRGGKNLPLLEDILQIDGEWRVLNGEADQLRAERNKSADEIGRLKKEKKDASGLIQKMNELKGRLKDLEEKARALETQLTDKILAIPNLPHASVPVGKDASENKERRAWGDKPHFSFKARDHQVIGTDLGILDFPRAAKLSGSRFSLLVGQGARLERALIQFMLDMHTQQHGYQEVLPPFLVSRTSMTGTGQLPKFEEELYAMRDDELFLIPTAEVPLTNLLRDETLTGDGLPCALCAYTACFRREAGSYGKDTRGLIRNHQFNKIELVRFVHPDQSLAELELLTGHAEEVLKQLKLPYRVLELCTGDLGFSAAKTYDLEVWMPGDTSAVEKGKESVPGSYREISSCSTFTDFQSRRIGIRYKADKDKGLVHTLNGSGVAVGRTMAAVLENYQQEDGSVLIPEVLRPYMNGQEKLAPHSEPPLGQKA